MAKRNVSDFCSICDEGLGDQSDDEVVNVKQKGLKTLIESSKKKEDNKWIEWEKKDEILFHVKCRKRYAVSTSKFAAKKKKLNTLDSEQTSSASGNSKFPFDVKCFLCSELWTKYKKVHRRTVTTNMMKYSLLGICEARNDDWGNSVRAIIESVPSLVTATARYHIGCYTRFTCPISGNRPGRPPVNDLAAAFEKVCEYIENSYDSQFLLSDLHSVMGDYIPTNEKLFEMLQNKYGERILIFRRQGSVPIICFRDAIMGTLSTKSQVKGNAAETLDANQNEEQRMFDHVAATLRRDIQSCTYDSSSYQSPMHFLSNVENEIPASLNYFIGKLLAPTHKQASPNIHKKKTSVAHAIISAVRPQT